MFRTIKVKRCIPIIIPVLKYDIRQFHVTKKLYARRTREDISDSVRPEKLRNEFDPLVDIQNSSIDFYGIESGAGVITLGPPQNKLTSSVSQTKLKEKFHKASFGVVRYETDNKLKYHGQYKNAGDVLFPCQDTDNAEVVKLAKHSTDYSNTLNKNSEFDSFKKIEKNDNYIDELYFSNISETDNTNFNDATRTSKELNFIDEQYFETSQGLKLSENHISGKEVSNYVDGQTSSEFNFLDKSNIETTKASKERNEIFIEREHSSEENVSHSFEQEINFFDENYFKNVLPENQKVPVMPKISGDKIVNLKSNYDCQKEEISKPNDSEFFSINLNSDIIENEKTDIKGNHMLHKYSDYNEPTTDFLPDIKSKKIIEPNKEINQHRRTSKKVSEQKLKEVEDNFENSDSSPKILNTDLISKKRELHGNIQTVKSVINEKDSKHSSLERESEDMSTAYDFVTKLRKEQEILQNVKKEGASADGEKFDSKGFRILKNQVVDLTHFTKDEILNVLKQNVVYSDNDLLVLNKPYGLVIHESKTTKYPCLSSLLNDLARDLDKNTTDPKLYTVHRLDKETTGCLLLARNETTAQYLKSLFAERKIIKTYWILTSRVPDPHEGIIDIPITEGSINNRRRMVLHAKLPKDIGYRNHSKHGKQAVTSYKVISAVGNAALVEVFPKTGVKHQIRVHFGFGLSCPILGDHKYSHLDKLVPQKLPSDILQRLQVRQSKVRHIPMHIHAKSITIPQYFEDRDLFVNIPIPHHFKINLKRLKFKKK